MGECDAVLSGSAALQFFDRVRWSECDLDIYVKDLVIPPPRICPANEDSGVSPNRKGRMLVYS
ncbi:hypothetical protein BDD12DRAFT_858694 [Trichophaea hybrida]|nr:hypothetical protein BDD12DRAFT_858694 [Trichophaea hybrida]